MGEYNVLEKCSRGQLILLYRKLKESRKEEIQKQKEITEKLKESNEFYANSNNWQTPESQGFRVDDFCLEVADMIEEIDSRNSNLGGNLARQIKKEVEEMEKLK